MTTPSSFDRSLVGMEDLQEILETVFFTACINETIPLSLILIGPPGSGKSKSILQFHCTTAHRTNDITSQGLAELMEDDKAGAMRHIIIPDFNIVVSHKVSTSSLTVASLLTLMSEGIMRIDDGRRRKEIIHSPIGIITAMTREIYEEHHERFRKLGINRRFIPLFFTYGIATRGKVQDSIKNGNTTLRQLQPKTVVLPKQDTWPITIKIDSQHAVRIEYLSRDMVAALSAQPQWTRAETGNWVFGITRINPPLEFTPHMILRAMAQAHALRAGRKAIDETEINFLIRFVTFMDYAQPVQL